MLGNFADFFTFKAFKGGSKGIALVWSKFFICLSFMKHLQRKFVKSLNYSNGSLSPVERESAKREHVCEEIEWWCCLLKVRNTDGTWTRQGCLNTFQNVSVAWTRQIA